MLTEGKLKALCENAGVALTGRKITVRLAQPVIRDFDGQFHSPNVVDIKLSLPDEQFLYVLCHELAHAALKHTTNNYLGRGPGSLELTPAGMNAYKYSPVSRKREDACDEMAKRWLYFAEQNYRRFPGETILEQKLRALGAYVPPRLQAQAAKVGWREGELLAEVVLWKQEQAEIHDRHMEKLAKLRQVKGKK